MMRRRGTLSGAKEKEDGVSDPGGDTEKRLEALENKMSYQEMTISDLSAQAYAQSLKIDALEKLVRQAAERLKELAGVESAPMPADKRPPHY
jgi:SlyX protein